MSRYIDADALKENCYKKMDELMESTSEHLSAEALSLLCGFTLIDYAPSIDIVRCKECKFSESVITSWSTDGKNNVVERLCKVHKWSVKDDDYCSYAERKESE